MPFISLYCLTALAKAFNTMLNRSGESGHPYFWSSRKSFQFFTIKFDDFPDSSVGKESACSAGYPALIPGSGRFTGEGIGNPLQHSWASLVAQLVKNPPVMQEAWVRSLGWKDPLEKGTTTHSNILAWRIPWTV